MKLEIYYTIKVKCYNVLFLLKYGISTIPQKELLTKGTNRHAKIWLFVKVSQLSLFKSTFVS